MPDSDFVYPAGRRLQCQHCRGERFHMKRTRLEQSTLIGSLFDVDFLFAHSAVICVCQRCGFAHFFFPDSVTSTDESEPPRAPAEPIDCLSCGQTIAPGLSVCPACGWTWA